MTQFDRQREPRVAGGRSASDARAASFYRDKIATARFYADQILPQADAWAATVTAGDSAIQGIGSELFD